MGILITVKDADFSSNYVGFVPPVSKGLRYWNYFGGAPDRTTRNLAEGREEASLMGEAAVGDNHCSFDSGRVFLQTRIDDLPAATLACVARAPDLGEGTGFMIGSFAAAEAGQVGSCMFFQNGMVHCAAGRESRGGQEEAVFTSVLPPTVGSWGFYVAQIGEEVQVLADQSRNIRTEQDRAARRAPPNGRCYRIGSSWSGQTGKVDIAFAAIYEGQLGSDDVKSVYLRVRKYLASRDILI